MLASFNCAHIARLLQRGDYIWCKCRRYVRARCATHRSSAFRFSQKLNYCNRKRSRIAWGNQYSRQAMINNLGHATRITRNNSAGGRHRFLADKPRRLPDAGKDTDAGGGKNTRNVLIGNRVYQFYAGHMRREYALQVGFKILTRVRMWQGPSDEAELRRRRLAKHKGNSPSELKNALADLESFQKR